VNNLISNHQWNEFPDQQQLVQKLADVIEVSINQSITERGRAILALSGGSTPKPLFAELAIRKINWSAVIITLVDERWVDETHELSNAAFMKTFLLSKMPEKAKFVPLYHVAENPAGSLIHVLRDYCVATDSSIDRPAAFDVVVLGMGNDGHTASFFPDASNIAELVSGNTDDALQCCESETTQVPRITWSLPILLNTQMLVLHITGSSKRAVFERALSASDATELPIRSAIFQQQSKLNVYYAG